MKLSQKAGGALAHHMRTRGTGMIYFNITKRYASTTNNNTPKCSTCQDPNCTPGKHCSLGWSTTPKDKGQQYPQVPQDNPNEVAGLANRVMVGTYAKPPIIFTSGKGMYMYDSKGERYLDFTAGIAVNALGHSDPQWVEAVTKQAKLIAHTSNLYHTMPSILLARSLVTHSQLDKVFFSNSGTEANEAALKFSRKYARHYFLKDENNFKKTEFVAFTHGFSGRSMGSVSVTHKSKYRAPFMPLIPGVKFAEYNDVASVEAVISENTCAVIVEPVQGEGGVTPATPEFLRGLRALCNKYNALLIVDEVQCGLGRTGRLWAHEAYGIKPDIMTLAKPLAGGLPIGACLVTDKVAQAINVGEHGSTFAGGPLACAVAQTVFDRISNPQFLEDVRAKGDYLVSKLRQLPGKIKEVRHAGGLFAGVEFTVPVKKLVADAQEHGVLFVNAGENVLRICPPLIVERQHIDQAIDLLHKLIPKMEENM